MPLTDNLISYWKLDEASGNALDAHGSNDLTDTNTVGSAAGKINNARDFERDTTEEFSRADNADLSTGDIDFTISCWVNLESKPAGSGDWGIAGKWGSNGEWALQLRDSTDRFSFVIGNSSTNGRQDANTLGSPSIATWYFIVAWHDSVNNTVNIQVNDGTVDSLSYSSGGSDQATTFHIGNIGAGFGQHFDGLIDEFGFWKRVLTSDERAALYNSGNGFAYPFVAQVGGAFGGSFPIKRTYRPAPFMPGIGR